MLIEAYSSRRLDKSSGSHFLAVPYDKEEALETSLPCLRARLRCIRMAISYADHHATCQRIRAPRRSFFCTRRPLGSYRYPLKPIRIRQSQYLSNRIERDRYA